MIKTYILENVVSVKYDDKRKKQYEKLIQENNVRIFSQYENV